MLLEVENKLAQLKTAGQTLNEIRDSLWHWSLGKKDKWTWV